METRMRRAGISRKHRRIALRVAVVAAVLAAAVPVTQAAFAANGASATFTKSSDWGSGYEGKYTIVNGSPSSLTWRVEFDLPSGATISSFWDAQVVKSGNHVTATGTWNGTLSVGGSTSFGWIGAPGGVTPTNCLLNGASCSAGGTVDTTPPTTPGTLSSPSKTTTSINLSWGASTDSGGSGLAGYNVYRNGSSVPTGQTTGTTFTDTGLTPNTTYTYTVRARDGAGNLSPNSNQISVTTNSSSSDTTPPTTPGTLSSPSKTSSSINLSWGASTDSGGSGLAGYNIYRNGASTPTAQTSGTGTTYNDSGLSASTAYTYTVRARDGAGNLSNPSNQISVTTNAPPQGGATRKVAYFAQWGVYARNYKVKNIDTSGSANRLTHINYAFGNVNEQGRCFMANQLGQGDAWADYQMKYTTADSVNGTADTWNSPLAGSFNQLKQLKAKYPHLKVYISLGGWTWSKYFSNMALPANRAAGVASCIDLYIKGNLPLIGGEVQGGPGSAFGIFDGIDLDWEWPASEGNVGNVIRAEDKANFLALVQEFRSQLNAYGSSVGRTYDLTAFLPADHGKIDAGINASVFNSLTFATIQGYDFYGPWGPQTNHQSQLRNPAANPAPATQRYSVVDAINKYLSMGAPASKLVVGVPAYGKGWTGVPNVNNGLYQNSSGAAQGTYEAGTEDYDVLKNRAGTVFRDNTNGAVWKFDGTTFWSYDDPQLITSKGQYVKANGLGGLMIWSLDGDDGTLVAAMQTGLA
jgi:chitinase